MTTTPSFTFPFGRPVTSRPPSADGPRRLFVLGAYPSALHVHWTPPTPHKPIKAIAVDNEPTPFWTGAGEAELIETWANAVDWRPEWGSVAPVGELNGSSGKWVEKKVLAPLKVEREAAWITDCLDTYRCSSGAAARLKDTYLPFADGRQLNPHNLAAHPSEGAIVAEALRDHRDRLRRELEAAGAERVVTLGNAALRVLAGVVEVVGVERPKKLAVEGYGTAFTVRVGTRQMEWLPLAHPAAPPRYHAAHEAWMAAR